jgi:hypothetical protein
MAHLGHQVPFGKHGSIPGLPSYKRNFVKKEDRQVVKDAYRFCKRLVNPGREVMEILSNQHRSLTSKINSRPAHIIALHMKEDFGAVKN